MIANEARRAQSRIFGSLFLCGNIPVELDSEGDRSMRVQIYTNDREEPIDLAVREIRTKAREVRTDEQTNDREHPVDQTLRKIIKDPNIGTPANLLFTTEDGREGAIYLNTDKIAAVVTSWPGEPEQAE
ncbi:MAG: hypothetical protein M3N18_00075 [Actinomycetota bacterium]|nr:hypothetical protein [Actinomycetota bacterium]